ncbi:hypothetical protein CPB86DRAFT_713134 [Serendipita vermifera]|nr:hypothetical protein CPB86DRAFT_713134 [Serendipita vermifera]
MLPSVLLTAFLGAQLAAGAVIVQNDAPQALALTVADRWNYELCGTEEDIVEVESISISPDPPKPGEDLEITAKGKVKQTLEEGAYADVTVKLGLIKLLQKEFDICEEARNANATIQCPVEPGDYTLVQKVALPKEIPPGKFSIFVQANNANDDPATCIKIHVDFGLHRPGHLSLW